MATAHVALPDGQEDLLPRGGGSLCPGSGQALPGTPPPALHGPPASFLSPLGGSGDWPWVAVFGGGRGCLEEGVCPSLPAIGPQMEKRREGRKGQGCTHTPPTLTTVSLRLLSPHNLGFPKPFSLSLSSCVPREPRAQLVSPAEWSCDLLMVTWPRNGSTWTQTLSSPTLNAALLW